MNSFSFFLKTYEHDKERVIRLIESYNKHNIEKHLLYLMCPDEDVDCFSDWESTTVRIIKESAIKTDLFTEDTKWSKGYLNQEIFKLAFWELGLCENYQCIDSDAVFIRDFVKRDFMYDEDTPYTVLVEDNDLRADYYYNKLYWNGRMKWLKKIQDELDFHPYKMLTCHGFQIISAKAIKSFKEEFLEPRKYTYKSIIEIAPYEFSWYNFWLQKTEAIPIHMCEPNFKTFHLKQHLINDVLRGMSIDDWAKGYVGVVVNSNFDVGIGCYEDLSVYSFENAEIPLKIIRKNYEFYGGLLKKRSGILKKAGDLLGKI